jgi:predicted nucleotidyltransferase
MAISGPLDTAAIADFCRSHHIRRLALFGSVLRGDFTADSDVDFLVEFKPEHVPGMLRLAGMEIELSQIVGRRADMRTLEDLNRRFRHQVASSASTLYVS